MPKRKIMIMGFFTFCLTATLFIGVTATPWDGVVDDPTPAQAIWVDPKNTTCFDVGETFVVDVLINITDPDPLNSPPDGLFGFDYKLKWGSTILEVVEIQTHTDNVPSGDRLPGWTSVWPFKNETGSNFHWYGVVALGGTGFTGVASLCTYTFRVISDGSCSLNIYDDELTDDTATLIAHTTVDGYVTITNTCVIRADGSVFPPTAPISSVDNVTYTLTGNIEKPILVERDNIVVDGAGFTVQGTGDGKGISMLGRSNVTIKNMRIESFDYGIWLQSSSNNTISGNNITANLLRGISLYDSSNNSISGNNVTDSGFGIWLENSSSNIISENKITDCGMFGMVLSSSSSNNTLYGNNMTTNGIGIWLSDSSKNTFLGNVMDGNVANFGGVSGSELGHFMHSIDVSNLVDGKPVHYLVNQTNLLVDSATHQVGYLALINCVNVTVTDLNLTNNGEGLLLAYTNNSRITDNNIIDNHHGVTLFTSSNNTLSKNTITDNYADGFYLQLSSNNTISENTIKNNNYGIELYDSSNNSISRNTIKNSWWGIQLYESSNNSIYHNNLVDNTVQVYTEDSVNVWDDDYPSGGNYWSDHNPPDIYSGPHQNETGGDGIGDTPYIINENNTDKYPLIYPYDYVPSPDANQDGIVDIVDLCIVSIALWATPGDPEWKPIADLNYDNLIDIVDLTIVTIHLWETV